MPSSVTPVVTWFDRFAAATARVASRAWFFAACVAMIVLWLPSYWLVGDFDTWQLVINTLTTIVTFLLVALLQNAQTRADAAVQHKLNAIAAGLASQMRFLGTDVADEQAVPELDAALRELCAAVGVERHESS